MAERGEEGVGGTRVTKGGEENERRSEGVKEWRRGEE